MSNARAIGQFLEHLKKVDILAEKGKSPEKDDSTDVDHPKAIGNILKMIQSDKDKFYEEPSEENSEVTIFTANHKGKTGVDDYGQPVEKKPKEIDLFYCDLCKISCTGQVVLDTHLIGKKHMKNLKKLKFNTNAFPSSRPNKPIFVGPVARIQKNLSEIAEKEPIVGLEYVSEYQFLDKTREPRYFCELCEYKASQEEILLHVVRQKHRLRYMRTHCFDIYYKITHYPTFDNMMKPSEAIELLKRHSAFVVRKNKGMIGQVKVKKYFGEENMVIDDEKYKRMRSIHPSQHSDLAEAEMLLENAAAKEQQEKWEQERQQELIEEIREKQIELKRHIAKPISSKPSPKPNNAPPARALGPPLPKLPRGSAHDFQGPPEMEAQSGATTEHMGLLGSGPSQNSALPARSLGPPLPKLPRRTAHDFQGPPEMGTLSDTTTEHMELLSSHLRKNSAHPLRSSGPPLQKLPRRSAHDFPGHHEMGAPSGAVTESVGLLGTRPGALPGDQEDNIYDRSFRRGLGVHESQNGNMHKRSHHERSRAMEPLQKLPCRSAHDFPGHHEMGAQSGAVTESVGLLGTRPGALPVDQEDNIYDCSFRRGLGVDESQNGNIAKRSHHERSRATERNLGAGGLDDINYDSIHRRDAEISQILEALPGPTQQLKKLEQQQSRIQNALRTLRQSSGMHKRTREEEVAFLKLKKVLQSVQAEKQRLLLGIPNRPSGIGLSRPIQDGQHDLLKRRSGLQRPELRGDPDLNIDTPSSSGWPDRRLERDSVLGGLRRPNTDGDAMLLDQSHGDTARRKMEEKLYNSLNKGALAPLAEAFMTNPNLQAALRNWDRKQKATTHDGIRRGLSPHGLGDRRTVGHLSSREHELDRLAAFDEPPVMENRHLLAEDYLPRRKTVLPRSTHRVPSRDNQRPSLLGDYGPQHSQRDPHWQHDY